ncbi:MAG: S8 family serine peptidase, partial [Chloroflexi bacterium]|nr:S8 family serine peptidase [Chloroflexota bacterium]
MNHQTSRGDSTRATELFHAASRWLPLLFVASLLLLLAVRTTNSVADAQAPLVPTLERAEITEGRSLAFLISNTPSGHAAYHLRVQPIGGAFTAHPDDFTVWSIVPTDEQRDDADYIIPPGIAKTVTRDSLGKIEFEVEAHSDNAADDGEAFGLQLCSTPHCEDEAVLGDWTVSILDAILPDDRLDDGLGDGLGPAEDRFSLASMLGDDGVYVWQDGDRPIPMRLLDSLTAAEQAALDELAQPAARAYVPSSPEGGNGSSTTQPLSVTNWFRSDTGQLMLLTGGVNVIFEPHADSAVIDALFHRRGIGPERISPIGELHNGYHVATSSDAETLRLVAELLSEPIVVIADPDWFSPVTTHQSWPNTNKVARALCTKYTKWLSDELSSCLWHLNADTDYRYREVDPIIDINIDDVWETTKGEGITAMIVDARWQPRHEDLIDNVDFDRNDLGRQWVIESFTAHGTSVAGIIGARDNALGGRGVAPRASLIQHDYLGLFSNKSELESVLFQKNIVAVTNRSYGERGNGAIRQSSSWRWALDAVVREAFSGRGGLQVISAGNEFAAINNPGDGWTGLDESLTHRGVVTVAAVNSQGVSTAYSDIGPNVWVSAPSSDHTRGQPGILTTVGNNHYTASFGGTSAAAPIVTGVVALIRAANPDLTWRDVKLILAATAQKNDPTGAAQKAGAPTAWTDGAIKYGEQTARYVSNYLYGFGVVDADAAVTAAQSWTLVPDLITATASSSSALAVPGSKGEVETSLSIQSNMDFIEYVNVDVNMTTKNFRNLRVTLVSPSGEESILSPAIDSCPSGCGIDGTFQFGTARHLGEDPSGVWKLKIYNNAAQRPAEATLNSWTLTIYGHKTDMKSRRVILSVSSPTVDEGSAVTLTAKIIGAPPAQDVTIPISLEGISAEAPGTAKSDFGALTSITVKASASSGSGYITTVQDTFSEADETFRATLGNLPSGYVTPGGSPVVTILDNDPLPVVEMVVSSTSVKEGHSFAVSAKIDRVWSDNIQVCVDVMHITAVYWSRSKCVWIPAGSLVSNQFHLTVIRSPYYRPPSRTSTFQVPGFLSRGSRLAPPKPATVTVIEVDKPPVLDLSVWPTNIDEGGVVTVTAALRGSMIASPVTIPVVLTAGTATPPGSVGADYTSLSSITIPIIHNTSRSVGSRIRATNDRRQEGDETFTVAFGTLPDTVAPGRIDPITVVIKDNDAPSATIHPTADVTEGDDAAFSIHVGALPGSPSSVRVSATITQSGDFAKSTATQTITVPTGGSARLNVPTVDDGTAESDGSVTATLNPGPYYTVSS